LQESVARFVLWGLGWSEGRLDLCLDGSVELRNNVIELLAGLTKALLQCKWFLLVLLVVTNLKNPTYQSAIALPNHHNPFYKSMSAL
jgi:hypothetical protein